jgi:uncharacterized membrane protein
MTLPERILEYLKDNPGAKFRALLKDLSVPFTPAREAVAELVASGLVIQSSMRQHLYLPGDAPKSIETRLARADKHDITKADLKRIGTTAPDLAPLIREELEKRRERLGR